MKRKIEKYRLLKHLFTQEDKLLLAVSGGIDSMVMLEIMSAFSNEIGIVHCNFQLRGDESRQDEDLVCKIAKKKNLPLYVKSFDTKKYAKENKLSVQMAARELRYTFFEELASQYRYTKILTAHHLDDNIETFFIHLLRSSGLKGLQGIPAKRGLYIRPLLGLSRGDIKKYAEKYKVEYREDKSNAETKYLRNKIRHQLNPILEKIDKQYRQNIQKSLDYLSQSNKFIERELQNIITEKEETKGEQKYLPIPFLKSHPDALLILHYWLRDKGFSDDNLQSIKRNIQTIKVGKFYYSRDYLLVIDRAYLVLSPVEEQSVPTTILRSEKGKIDKPIALKWDAFVRKRNFKIQTDSSQAFLDFDKIKFPLLLRQWKNGDRFQALGMKGEKKVSDFLIDEKINRAEKKKVFVLFSGSDILWIVGYRISEKYKICEDTKRIFWMEKR